MYPGQALSPSSGAGGKSATTTKPTSEIPVRWSRGPSVRRLIADPPNGYEGASCAPPVPTLGYSVFSYRQRPKANRRDRRTILGYGGLDFPKGPSTSSGPGLPHPVSPTAGAVIRYRRPGNFKRVRADEGAPSCLARRAPRGKPGGPLPGPACFDKPLSCDLSVPRRDRVSRREHMMCHCGAGACRSLGQPETVAARSARVVVSIDDQDGRLAELER